VATILFTSNLIGIIFARSLHYQFYSWYAQQIPFLAWRTRYPWPLKWEFHFATFLLIWQSLKGSHWYLVLNIHGIFSHLHPHLLESSWPVMFSYLLGYGLVILRERTRVLGVRISMYFLFMTKTNQRYMPLLCINASRMMHSFNSSIMHVFLTVGSTRFDALIVSAFTERFLSSLRKKGYTALVIQCGNSAFEVSSKIQNGETQKLSRAGVDIEFWKFKPSLQEDYEKADLVISHAGRPHRCPAFLEMLMEKC